MIANTVARMATHDFGLKLSTACPLYIWWYIILYDISCDTSCGLLQKIKYHVWDYEAINCKHHVCVFIISQYSMYICYQTDIIYGPASVRPPCLHCWHNGDTAVPCLVIIPLKELQCDLKFTIPTRSIKDNVAATDGLAPDQPKLQGAPNDFWLNIMVSIFRFLHK